MAYWYHFAIMFEALFILTTIDTGTRVGRFLLQEFGGTRVAAVRRNQLAAGRDGVDGSSLVLAWAYFIWTGNISTIWPMFGIANQLLASVALAVGTTIIINIGRAKYAWVTFLPLCFVSTTTLSAGYLSVRDNFWPMAVGANPALQLQGYVNSICTVIMMICAVIILGVGCPAMGDGADREEFPPSSCSKRNRLRHNCRRADAQRSFFLYLAPRKKCYEVPSRFGEVHARRSSQRLTVSR